MGIRNHWRTTLTCLSLSSVLLQGCGASRPASGTNNYSVNSTPTPIGIDPTSSTGGTGPAGDGNTVGNANTSSVTNPPVVLATAGNWKLEGRFEPGVTNPNAPQLMTWPGATIIANFTGSTKVQPTFLGQGTNGTEGDNIFDLSVDGAAPTRFDAQEGAQAPVISNLDPSKQHTVTLRRLTEVAYGWATFTGFNLDANGVYLQPPAQGARRMEVIGDSITCGYGDLGSITSSSCDPFADEDNSQTYGALAAASLGADLSVVAWSGKGMYLNNDNTTTLTMPELWRLEAGTDQNTLWNPAYYQPQVVVVALGTNDFVTWANPNAASPTNPAISFNTAFTQTYVQFLVTLRQAYPSAQIIATVGPMYTDSELVTADADIQSAVSTRNQAGDPNVHVLDWQCSQASVQAGTCPAGQFSLDTSTEGCAFHPNVAGQTEMATALTAQVKSLLGW